MSRDTPHWNGYHELQESLCLDYHEAGFDVIAQDYTIVSQYGTHVDVPAHFVPDGRTHYPGWAGSASAICCSRISSRSS